MSNAVSILITAKDNASDTLSKVSSGVEQIDKKAQPSTKSMLGLGAAIGAVSGVVQNVFSRAMTEVSSLVGDAVKRVDTLNNFPKIMANFGVSAADATTMINALDKGVRGLPTSLNNIATLAESFVPLTKNTEMATKTALALNNAVLAGGTPMDIQANALEQFRQALSKGVPDLQDWKSLEVAMPAQLQQVTKKLGIGTGALKDYTQNGLGLYKAMKQGKLSMDDFNKALIALNSEGINGLPSFAEQAKNATGGIQTSMANLKNAVNRGIADVINAFGTANISGAASGIGKALEDVGKGTAVAIEQTKVFASAAAVALAPALEALGNTITKNVFPALNKLYQQAIKPLIPVIGTLLVGALKLTVDALNVLLKVGSSVLSFLVDHKTAVIAAAGAITTFLLPAFIQLGIIWTQLTIKAYISAAATALPWTRTAVTTSAAWYASSAKVVASFVATAAKAVANAVATSAVWVANAAVASAAWVVTELPKIIGSFLLVSVKAALYAADTSLAWTINAFRVSTVWVVTEMPKLVASFAATVASATVQAALTSAAWVANATKTSVAWVITELPKIIIGFVTTAAAATFNAAVTSGAWVASASTSAVAWVVTELPRIIAAFITTSGAAIANAAIAAVAWTTAAATSTQSYLAFRALVASPIPMGAIAIAGALADIALVMKAIQSVRDAISDLNAKAASAANAKSAATQLHAQLLQLEKSGTAAQKARAQSLIMQGYATGGYTGRGSPTDVAGVVHKGEYVLPSSMVNQNTGQPKGAGGITINFHGPVSMNDQSDIESLAKRIMALQDQKQRLVLGDGVVIGTKFGSYDLQSAASDPDGFGCTVTGTDVYNPPQNKIQADALPEADGALIVKQQYDSKTFPVTGYLRAADRTSLEQMKDAFVLAMTVKNQAFDIDMSGGVRRYLCNAQNIAFTPNSVSNFGFSVQMFSPDGMGWDVDSSTLLSATAVTAPTVNVPVTVGGTYQAQPLITATISSFTGSGTRKVSIGNGVTLRSLSVSRSWTTGDVIEIDSLKGNVFVNNAAVDFTGQFPRFDVGDGSISWVDSFTARSVSLTAGYTKRWL